MSEKFWKYDVTERQEAGRKQLESRQAVEASDGRDSLGSVNALLIAALAASLGLSK